MRNRETSGQLVLILSVGDDYHAQAVSWALERLGAQCHVWDRTRFPHASGLSISIATDSDIAARGHSFELRERTYASIWNRRGGPEPSKALHPEDHKLSLRESKNLIDGLVLVTEAANPSALLVNSLSSKRAADSKLLQLCTAKRAGFRIPSTLISNQKDEILRFRRAHNNRIIGKLSASYAWKPRDSGIQHTLTTFVTDDMLSDGEGVRASPTIYQEALTISSEIRVVMFGRTTFGIETLRTASSPEAGRPEFDGRIVWSGSRPFEVPETISGACRTYMRLMGLNFAAFDLAVSDGNLYFLEANEAGQFLFLERRCPELPLLDAFAKFLASGSADFSYTETAQAVRLSHFSETESAQALERISMMQRRGIAASNFTSYD